MDGIKHKWHDSRYFQKNGLKNAWFDYGHRVEKNSETMFHRKNQAYMIIAL